MWLLSAGNTHINPLRRIYVLMNTVNRSVFTDYQFCLSYW
nr:MAG TPA: hypothetical protein [Caudoviricetes sp.]